MSLYSWNGPEKDLYGSCCVATQLTITSIEDRGDNKFSEGEITVKDYAEGGIVFTEPWEAVGIPQEDGSFQWSVRRKECEGAFWRDPKTEEPLFTCNSVINENVKQFVAQQVNEHFATGKKTSEPIKFTGPYIEYTGPCVCEELRNSNIENPFNWEEMTNGGKFPENCFACSCGRKWWSCDIEQHIWAEIGDPEAWPLLRTFNGVPVEKLGLFKDRIYLLQTLRNRGLIPIG